MNSQHTVTATVTVRVPLGARGTLADGAQRIVERPAAVDRLETATVCDISPGLNDTTVELEAELAVDHHGDTRLHDDLTATTGIVSVEHVKQQTAPIEADVG